MYAVCSPAGDEPAVASSADDLEQCLRDAREALSVFNATAALACRIGEHKLQREAEDATARLFTCVTAFEQQLATRERQRGSEAVHGQNPQNAEVNDPFLAGGSDVAWR